ncbi:hypothetical protein Dimus_024066 [Dionaea muscipula]
MKAKVPLTRALSKLYMQQVTSMPPLFLLLLLFIIILFVSSSYLIPFVILSLTLLLLLLLLLYYPLHRLLTKPYPVLLLNYSCYKPPPHRKCTLERAEYFIRKTGRFTHESEDFMRSIYLKSGLGNETYGPPFFVSHEHDPSLASALEETREGMFAVVDNLLSETGISPSQLDIVVVTSGCFSPSPSTSSLLVNKYGLRSDVRTFSLTGMGCSSGVLAVDLAAKLVSVPPGSQRRSRVQYALVVVTENISMNWYFGDNRSMLVTNCLFRVGCAAAIVTNDPSRLPFAKFRLVHSLRTHHGSDDRSYRAAIQEEDEKGYTGISITKELIGVAGENIRQHMKLLAPRVLPVGELIKYVGSVVVSTCCCCITRAGRDQVKNKQREELQPDFTRAFEHMCIHTGGKKVIERVGSVMRLGGDVTEASRMSLHRFGNTSSSLVFYQLAYLDAKRRIKKGDRVWMLAFGTGFKVASLVWIAAMDSHSHSQLHNPWDDCIHKYPLNY